MGRTCSVGHWEIIEPTWTHFHSGSCTIRKGNRVGIGSINVIHIMWGDEQILVRRACKCPSKSPNCRKHQKNECDDPGVPAGEGGTVGGNDACASGISCRVTGSDWNKNILTAMFWDVITQRVFSIWVILCKYENIYPSIHLSIYPSIYLSIYVSIYLSIYLPIYIAKTYGTVAGIVACACLFSLSVGTGLNAYIEKTYGTVAGIVACACLFSLSVGTGLNA